MPLAEWLPVPAPPNVLLPPCPPGASAADALAIPPEPPAPVKLATFPVVAVPPLPPMPAAVPPLPPLPNGNASNGWNAPPVPPPPRATAAARATAAGADNLEFNCDAICIDGMGAASRRGVTRDLDLAKRRTGDGDDAGLDLPRRGKIPGDRRGVGQHPIIGERRIVHRNDVFRIGRSPAAATSRAGDPERVAGSIGIARMIELLPEAARSAHATVPSCCASTTTPCACVQTAPAGIERRKRCSRAERIDRRRAGDLDRRPACAKTELRSCRRSRVPAATVPGRQRYHRADRRRSRRRAARAPDAPRRFPSWPACWGR